jgi:predicted RNA binding protein YcfA (HicA-like mRNA interferase family)
MGRVRRLTAIEVEQILQRHGFQLVSQKGSHRKWRHPQKGLVVVVPMHKGKTLPVGTLRAIMQGAEIPKEEWRTT